MFYVFRLQIFQRIKESFIILEKIQNHKYNLEINFQMQKIS